ncbi:MAG: hypothetical protein IPH81_08935 [Candidatus Microthrix sp.]|nr:hypothetical protein [Candidatus Microthrix sp.]
MHFGTDKEGLKPGPPDAIPHSTVGWAEIAVTDAQIVPTTFDARFSAYVASLPLFSGHFGFGSTRTGSVSVWHREADSIRPR